MRESDISKATILNAGEESSSEGHQCNHSSVDSGWSMKINRAFDLITCETNHGICVTSIHHEELVSKRNECAQCATKGPLNFLPLLHTDTVPSNIRTKGIGLISLRGLQKLFHQLYFFSPSPLCSLVRPQPTIDVFPCFF